MPANHGDRTVVMEMGYTTLQEGETFRYQCRQYRAVKIEVLREHPEGKRDIRVTGAQTLLTVAEWAELMGGPPAAASDVQGAISHTVVRSRRGGWSELSPWHQSIFERFAREPGYTRDAFFDAPLGIPYDRLDDHNARLTDAERAFLLRNVCRLESELAWLRNNNATVCRAYKETRSAGLSETTAAELALICVARECENLRRQNAKSMAAKIGFARPKLEPEYMI